MGLSSGLAARPFKADRSAMVDRVSRPRGLELADVLVPRLSTPSERERVLVSCRDC